MMIIISCQSPVIGQEKQKPNNESAFDRPKVIT